VRTKGKVIESIKDVSKGMRASGLLGLYQGCDIPDN